MKLYKSCKTLPIFNFYQVANENDYKYLIYDYDAENNDIDADEDELKELWRDILYEYYELNNDKRMLIKIQKSIKIEYLRTKIMIIQSLFLLYLRNQEYDVKDLLKKYGFKIDLNKDIEKEIQSIESRINGLKTRLKIMEVAFNKQYKDEEETNKNVLDETVARLDLNYNLDTKKVTVVRWIAIIKSKTKK